MIIKKRNNTFPDFRLEKDMPEEYLKELPLMNTSDRMHHIMQWLSDSSRVKSHLMLYIIMYDIEDNKIRTHLAKYLIKQGCLRIQKSVYLAKTSPAVMNNITGLIKEINELYENHDSVFVLPVPEDKFHNMKVIGKSVEFELVTQPRNVLIF
jgi:CRISPR-associated endonuclease Cas2